AQRARDLEVRLIGPVGVPGAGLENAATTAVAVLAAIAVDVETWAATALYFVVGVCLAAECQDGQRQQARPQIASHDLRFLRGFARAAPHPEGVGARGT